MNEDSSPSFQVAETYVVLISGEEEEIIVKIK